MKKESLKPMQKYKNAVDNRLKPELVNQNDLVNSKWKPIKYQEITLEYFLDKSYRTIFLKREKNLSWFQRLRLNQILSEFDYKNYLKESWLLKEALFEAIDDTDIPAVIKVMKDCLDSEHYRIQQFWRTLQNWLPWIEAFCDLSTEEFKFTNALTEWINNHCKIAKRVSCWFRYKDNYIRKLTAKFSR